MQWEHLTGLLAHPRCTAKVIHVRSNDTTLIMSDERSIVTQFRVGTEIRTRIGWGRRGINLNQQTDVWHFPGQVEPQKTRTGCTYHGLPRQKSSESVSVMTDPTKKTWKLKFNQIKESTRALDDSGLTMKGKVAVVNNFVLSKLWYTAEVIPPQRT